jgi:hypothetical protein
MSFIATTAKVGLLNVGFTMLVAEDGSTFGETLLLMNLDLATNLSQNNQVGLNEYCSIYF